jgi:uncharacterized membrane protein
VSCYHDNAFNLLGFALAALSNLGFSSRAVLTKRLNTAHPDAIDDINLFFKISLYGLVLLIPITLLFEGTAIAEILKQSVYEKSASSTDFNLFLFLFLLLLNGCLFATYNLTSYVVLRKTDLITHSVLNAFRRVFIIIFTTIYFNSSLSIMNLFGIFLAITGVVLFGYFRSNDKKSFH